MIYRFCEGNENYGFWILPKTPGVDRAEDPMRLLLRSLDDLRRRRRFNRFIKVKPYIDYLNTPKRKVDFERLSKDLENLRVESLGTNEHRFYKVIAEFFLVQNQRSFYNPFHIFGCVGSYVAEEFETRIYQTIPYIASVIGVDNEMETISFYDKLMEYKRFGGEGVSYKSKDWYIVEAIRQILPSKGWETDEFIRRMKYYYLRRTKKVYPEVVLMDLIHGEFDGLDKVEKAKKEKTIDFRQSPYAEEWAKGLE